MGDETVEKVVASLGQPGHDTPTVRFVVRALVNRLRSSGLTDETILEMLVR